MVGLGKGKVKEYNNIVVWNLPKLRRHLIFGEALDKNLKCANNIRSKVATVVVPYYYNHHPLRDHVSRGPRILVGPGFFI